MITALAGKDWADVEDLLVGRERDAVRACRSWTRRVTVPSLASGRPGVGKLAGRVVEGLGQAVGRSVEVEVPVRAIARSFGLLKRCPGSGRPGW
jgi:hypothetical protein